MLFHINPLIPGNYVHEVDTLTCKTHKHQNRVYRERLVHSSNVSDESGRFSPQVLISVNFSVWGASLLLSAERTPLSEGPGDSRRHCFHAASTSFNEMGSMLQREVNLWIPQGENKSPTLDGDSVGNDCMKMPEI